MQTLLDLELTAPWKPKNRHHHHRLRKTALSFARFLKLVSVRRRDIAYVDHREFDTRRSGKANVIRNSDLTAPFLKYRADELHVCIARLKGWQTGPRRMLWGKEGRERPPMPTSRSSIDCP